LIAILAAVLAAVQASGSAAMAPAFADAPPRHMHQVPGYYRMVMGDFEVTALYDGYVALDAAILKGASAADIQSLLARMFVPQTKDGVQTAVNAFLIHTGQRLVLVDAGSAACFGPTMGKIEDNIRAAGYAPERIDTILLTHLHPDHTCGLAKADGKAAFPNATVYVERNEAAYWLDKEKAGRAPKASEPFFKMAQAAVAPYVAQGRMKEFAPGAAIMDGISSFSLAGHTPGHTGFLLSSGEERMLVWGDVVHSHAVQFAHPDVSIEFDVDQKQAVESRRKALAEAAGSRLWVAGAHLPFPGLGHVRKERRGYAWVPVEYGPVGGAR
jgi:glyoxylase-like metal-dependent hydrolase (beta-lactamase superfamily II)